MSPVRYDVIRENGVGMMAAFTDDSHYTYGVSYSVTTRKVSNGSVIVSMDMTFTSGATDWTGFILWYEFSHISVQ